MKKVQSLLQTAVLLLLILSSCKKDNKSMSGKPDENSFDYQYKLGIVRIDDYKTETDSIKKKKYLQDAVIAFEKAYAKDSSKKELIYYLGSAYYSIKNYNGAIYLYKKYNELYPDDVKVQKNLRLAYRELARTAMFMGNDPSIAKMNAEKALSIEPKDPVTLEIMGVAECALSNFDVSVQYFKKALELNPNSYSLWTNLSIAYAKQGNLNYSKDALKKAQAINPNMRNPMLEKENY